MDTITVKLFLLVFRQFVDLFYIKEPPSNMTIEEAISRLQFFQNFKKTVIKMIESSTSYSSFALVYFENEKVMFHIEMKGEHEHGSHYEIYLNKDTNKVSLFQKFNNNAKKYIIR